MDEILILHISSSLFIIILSIVLLVNSIKTKNKLVMFLSIGTLVVSVGCLTYFLIHHFTSIKDDKDMKDIIKSTYQYFGDVMVKGERTATQRAAENTGQKLPKIDDFVVDPKSVDDGLALVKSHKTTLNELRQHSNDVKTYLSKLSTLDSSITSEKKTELKKIIDDFSQQIYWITPVLGKFMIKSTIMSLNGPNI